MPYSRAMLFVPLCRLILLFVAYTDITQGFSYNDLQRERMTELRIQYEEKNCTDKPWAHCDYFRESGLCRVYRRTLRNRCRKSCNFCGNIKTCAFSRFGCCWDMTTPAEGPNGEGCPRNCHNRLGQQKCSLLRLNGACVSAKTRMVKMCRGACLCDHAAKVQAPPVCALSQHGCCWDGATVANKYHANCPVCRNFLLSRVCRIFALDCYDVSGIKGWQMRRFCPKTCGICRLYKKQNLRQFAQDLNHELEALTLRTSIILKQPNP